LHGTFAMAGNVPRHLETLETYVARMQSLAEPEKRTALGLLGTAMGDVVGLPFELHAHTTNRVKLKSVLKWQEKELTPEDRAAGFELVRFIILERLKRASRSPYCRSFSDDTACTDMKMQAVVETHEVMQATSAPSDSEAEIQLFRKMLQHYLSWAHNADGNLFQGYGGFTKNFLKKTWENRLGEEDVTLFLPGTDYEPTDEYLSFVQDYFSGRKSEPSSWGNGAVMSFTPQAILDRSRVAHPSLQRAASVLSSSHQQRTAQLAAELLQAVLAQVYAEETTDCGCIRHVVLNTDAWKKIRTLTEDPVLRFHPILAFDEFLRRGDSELEICRRFAASLLLDSTLVSGSHRFGNFGELLHVLSNYDDEFSVNGERASVDQTLLRFSQRGLNTVIIAIWCASSARACENWLERVLYCGGDSDTVGAVTGQIACPLLEVTDVGFNFWRYVAVCDPDTTPKYPVVCAAAMRFLHRSILFAGGQWELLCNEPTLADPVYDGLIDMPSQSNQRRPARILCRHGNRCWDRDRGHREKYAHPGEPDWRNERRGRH